jgi:drug/metabolite transporter, DME family
MAVSSMALGQGPTAARAGPADVTVEQGLVQGQEAAVPVEEVHLYRRGLLFVLGATFFWSLSGLCVRLMEEASGWQVIFWRAFFLLITMVIATGLRLRHRIWAVMRDAGATALLAGTFAGMAGILYIQALGHTTVANVLFMSGISPFIAALVARWLLAEPVSRTTLISMAIAGTGIATMVGGGIAFDRLIGNILAFGTATCFALFGVTLRRGRRLDMSIAVLITGVFTSIAAGAVLLLEGAASGSLWAGFAMTRHDLMLCLFLGAVQQGVGTTCFTLGARLVPAAHLQLFAMSEMLMAPLWVWLAVGEVTTSATLLGGLLIVSALAFQATVAGRK